MNAWLQKPFSILVALVLILGTLTVYGAPVKPGASTPAQAAQPAPAGMPDELMRAFLEASSQPFEPGADGYRARSSALDFTLDSAGLQASGEGFVWSLAVDGFGREGQIAPVSDPVVTQTGGRLEYRRDSLTEWYRNTALGVEQGFTLHQAPSGTGPLILQLDLSTSFEDLVVTTDADGGGLSFGHPTRQTLRYDHLCAWDADGIPLEAHLGYSAGQVTLKVDDQSATYPITVDPLIYSEQEEAASEEAYELFGGSVALSGDTAVVGALGDDVGANHRQGSAYVFTRSGTEWSLQAQLTASDGAVGDEFGTSVALSGDTVLVGAASDDVNANTDQGSAYVFTRSGEAWTQQAKLTAADGGAADEFGVSVALSGDAALVGAPYDVVGVNIEQGSAYVFTRSGTAWTQQAQLTAADGAAGDTFATSVALSGDTALVGAYADDVGGNYNQGSAYFFIRSGTVWTQQAQLNAGDGAAGDEFGGSVALSGDTALVGAPYDGVGANIEQGSAYVFTRSGTTWTQQAQLTAADSAAGDRFGRSVALSGDTALVGAAYDDVGANTNQGTAYIFTRSGTAWTQQAKLIATDGAAGDYFGRSVVLDYDTALVGAVLDDIGPFDDQGSTTVFTRSGTVWAQQSQLLAADGPAGERYGFSVALLGDTALVGAYNTTVGSNAGQGSVFVFVRNGTVWTQQAQLTAADGAAGDGFGRSVALAGDTALVGAPADDVGENTYQGTAYIFIRSGTTWTQQAQLTAADGAAGDYFGISAVVSGDTAVVGAPYNDIGAKTNQGSAYVFTRSGTVWTQQARLTAADSAAYDFFGDSVALSGETALVGVMFDTVDWNYSQGSAYVFTRSGAAWTQQAQLTAADGAEVDQFGCSVALLGDTALVGAYLDDIGANIDQGSAYVFTRSGTVWTQQAQLTAAGGEAGDGFGRSVALSGDTALVGTPWDHTGLNSDQGSTYVYTRSGTTWPQQTKLTAADGVAEDYFGYSVALSGDTALVGAYLDDVGFDLDQGSAYVFGCSGTAWTQQAQLIFGTPVLTNYIYLPVVFRTMP